MGELPLQGKVQGGACLYSGHHQGEQRAWPTPLLKARFGGPKTPSHTSLSTHSRLQSCF